MADDQANSKRGARSDSDLEHGAKQTSSGVLSARLTVQKAMREADPGRIKALDYLSRRWL